MPDPGRLAGGLEVLRPDWRMTGCLVAGRLAGGLSWEEVWTCWCKNSGIEREEGE